MSNNSVVNEAIVQTIRQTKKSDNIVILSTGIKAKISPIAPRLLQDVMNRIKDPEVPKIYIEEKDTTEENPNDPAYLRALAENEGKRIQASLDAAILFGVELVDPVPDQSEWMPKLKLLEKMGYGVDLSNIDLNNPLELEFIYKKYIAVTREDFEMVTEISGVSEVEISRASDTFPD